MHFLRTSQSAMFYLVFFLLSLPLVVSARDLPFIRPEGIPKEIYQQYLQGNYCSVLERTASYQKLEKKKWLPVHLLRTEVLIELYRLDEADKNFAQYTGQKLPSRSEIRRLLLQARLQLARQQYFAADSTFREATRKSRSVLGEKDPLYAEILLFHGDCLTDLNYFTEAENALKKAEAILTTDQARSAQLKAIANSYLGFLYTHLADHITRKIAFEKARKIWEANRWEQHPYYQLVLNDQGLLLIQNNQLAEGLELIRQAEKIGQGPCSIPTFQAFNLTTRGDINADLNNTVEAKNRYSEALAIFEAHQLYRETAIALEKLGRLYLEDEPPNYAVSDSCFFQALQHLEKIMGEHPTLLRAVLLDNLAPAYPTLAAADSVYLLELQIIQKVIGENNLHFANALNNRGFLLELADSLSGAAQLYERSLAITEAIQSNKHPDYLITLYNLASVFEKLDTSRALALYLEANQLQLEIMNNYFASFDEQTRLDYRLTAMGNFDAFFNFAAFQEHPDFWTALLDISLATKNLALDYTAQTNDLADFLAETTNHVHWQQWKELRQQLTRAYHVNKRERAARNWSLPQLQARIREVEQQLVYQFPKRFDGFRTYDFNDIRNQLRAGEAALDFFKFTYIDEEGNYSEPDFYFCNIIRPEWAHPQLVQIENEAPIAYLLDSFDHYTKIDNVSHELYKKIWAPLQPFLEDIHTIHLSPDGTLHRIAFSGLVSDPETGKLLKDDFSIHYYSNLRDMVVRRSPIPPRPSLVILGDPAFELDLSAPGWQDAVPSEINVPLEASIHVPENFKALQGTQLELKLIRDQLDTAAQSVRMYDREKASEANLKQLPAADILHLATHGFFLKYQKDGDQDAPNPGERWASLNNPLLHSGLVLAGANYAWRGGRVPKGTEDGLLTAQEVTNLDLSSTRLVVLSACETGKGKVKSGEGVFGLQRAFKIAGAELVLVSLWKIPDQPTAELMGYFYQSLSENHDPAKALDQAQQQMRLKYPPYFWSGFVLFE